MQFSVYGVQIRDEIRESQLYWQLFIWSPFELEDHKLRYGINDKIIEKAQEAGVYAFLVGNVPIRVPSKKSLKLKIKNKEYEDKVSKFGGTFRIFHFII
jgi:hypothetical protein